MTDDPYFPVDSDPSRMRELARTLACLANLSLPVRRVPATATRLVVGPVLADRIPADAVFSNIRLRGIDFRFPYPTLEQGLRQVLGGLHE
jgi:NAD dependent epimerase/dehydratase family enzyme